jgi:hypothetical protein
VQINTFTHMMAYCCISGPSVRNGMTTSVRGNDWSCTIRDAVPSSLVLSDCCCCSALSRVERSAAHSFKQSCRPHLNQLTRVVSLPARSSPSPPSDLFDQLIGTLKCPYIIVRQLMRQRIVHARIAPKKTAMRCCCRASVRTVCKCRPGKKKKPHLIVISRRRDFVLAIQCSWQSPLK